MYVQHVFYQFVGKIIYKQAAEKLVPVTLELGGKSPAVITSDANVRVAARRIVNSKFSNCGQMCVAPDYVLVPTALKDSLIEELMIATKKFYGEDPENTDGYGKIINEKQWQRLVGYLQDGKVVYGGKSNPATLFIEPTILTGVHADAKIMQEEIFGPVVTLQPFESEEEALRLANSSEYGLAASVWTVWLWMTGLKTVPASQAGVFTVMLPISAAAVGVLWLGEPFSWLRVAGCTLIVVGVSLLAMDA